MQSSIVDTMLKEVGSIELPDEVFGVVPNQALLWEQVKAQRASRRRGTHATKTRGDVRGGGAKPHKQKGGGRARQGSSRSPNHVGGGTVFGPQPRDYAYVLPRSARKAALRSALSLRWSEGAIVVLKSFTQSQPKTKEVGAFLQRLANPSALLLDVGNEHLQRSTRNLVKSKYLEAEAANVYDILNHDKLVITEAGMAVLVAKALGVSSGEHGIHSAQAGT